MTIEWIEYLAKKTPMEEKIDALSDSFERIVEIYKTKSADSPDILLKLLQEQKQWLEEIKVQYGDYVAPTLF